MQSIKLLLDSPLSATPAVPQAVGAARQAAAAQPELSAPMPNTSFKAVSAPGA